MHQSRFSRSSAVVTLIGLLVLGPSVPASAQFASRPARLSSAAVPSVVDSTDAAVSGGSTETAPSDNEKAIALSSAGAGPTGMGLSGKVFARFLLPEDWITLAALPGDHASIAAGAAAYHQKFQTVFTMRSFGQKVRSSLNGYRLGYWPAEKGRRLRSEAYRNPDGFIEVTRENEDTRVSEHFRLRDFVSHGQTNVWPKYVVIREALLDKLELVIDDLNAHGINAEGLRIRSGFRTPAHNQAVRGEGSARDSRHQFGDAADVFIDQEGTGRMSDLNGDGKVNFNDVKLILAAVERVEARYPELVGGTGLYAGRSGSFAHIDVRGTRARWVRGVRRPRSHRYAKSKSSRSGSKVTARSSAKAAGKPSLKKGPVKTASASTSSRATATPR